MQPSLQQDNHVISAMIPRRTSRKLKSGTNTLTYLQTQLASKIRPRNSSSHYFGEEKTSLNLQGMQVSQTQMRSLDVAITKIRAHCAKHVNMSMAVFKLIHAQQGTKSMTAFAKEIDELATQCQFTECQYMKDRAIKDAIIFRTSDEHLG